MTAPTAAPSNAAPDLSGPHSFDSLIGDIANDAVQATLTEIGEPVVDANGNLHDPKSGAFINKKESEPNPAEQTLVDASSSSVATSSSSASTEESAEPATVPEGIAAVPKVDRPLATTFTIKDKDGELEIPDVDITFTANGKERTEPLDKVVKLAQWGVYNHEKEQAMQAQVAHAKQVETRAAELERYVAQIEAEVEKLLVDDDAYLNARAIYERQNTPEARAARQLQEVEAQREALTAQQWAMQGEQFFQTSVAPALDTIAKALPTVSVEELGAKMLLAIDQHRIHTKHGTLIPPQAYQAVQDAVLREVVPWAQMLHDSRAVSQPKPAPVANTQKPKVTESEKVQKAQVEAQKAKNLVAKTVRPIGSAASVSQKSPPPSKPAPKNVDDAIADAVADSVAAAMGG